jgi:integrase
MNTHTNLAEIINFPVHPIPSHQPVYHGNGTVQPIKNKEDIERAKQYFHDTRNTDCRYNNSNLNLRNYCLFVLGINIGRRISDMLSLRIGDFLDVKLGKIKDSIRLKEGKTNKYVTVFLNDNVKEAINEYLLSSYSTGYNSDDYLFKSRQGDNRPITRNMADKIIKDMGNELGLGNLGTHSMRKTFGYQIIQNNKDNDPYIMATLSEMFNHSSEKITRRYIGIDDEVKRDIYMNLNL